MTRVRRWSPYLRLIYLEKSKPNHSQPRMGGLFVDQVRPRLEESQQNQTAPGSLAQKWWEGWSVHGYSQGLVPATKGLAKARNETRDLVAKCCNVDSRCYQNLSIFYPYLICVYICNIIHTISDMFHFDPIDGCYSWGPKEAKAWLRPSWERKTCGTAHHPSFLWNGECAPEISGVPLSSSSTKRFPAQGCLGRRPKRTLLTWAWEEAVFGAQRKLIPKWSQKIIATQDFATQVWWWTGYTAARRKHNVAKGVYCKATTAERFAGHVLMVICLSGNSPSLQACLQGGPATSPTLFDSASEAQKSTSQSTKSLPLPRETHRFGASSNPPRLPTFLQPSRTPVPATYFET